MTRRSSTYPLRTQRRWASRRPSPLPFAFVGLAALIAFSVLARHPFLAFLGIVWFGRRFARRSRRWASREQWDMPVAPRRRQERSPEPPPVQTGAQRAYIAARSAVQRSTSLDDADRTELVLTLEQGLAAVRHLQTAVGEMPEPGDPSVASVAEAAQARAAQFIADCDSLRASLAALDIQGRDASALDAVAQAAEGLAGRVAARRELDALGDH